MKIRTGFVSNSSSSSFLIIKTNLDVIHSTLCRDREDEDELEHEKYVLEESCGDTSTFKRSIDLMIKELQEAKAKGATEVEIIAGEYYC